MKFKIFKHYRESRFCEIRINNKIIETPTFMPVGTYGSVKSLNNEEIYNTGSQIVLSNAFHLWLRLGIDRINYFNSLSNFLNWNGPILTDSGGFQIFSLNKIKNIIEEGVIFKDPISKNNIIITPEKSIEIQYILKSDIVMCFDECNINFFDKYKSKKSMEMSLRWAGRSKNHFEKLSNKKNIFGIIQGGIFKNLRNISLENLLNINFNGYAIGGLAIGETKKK